MIEKLFGPSWRTSLSASLVGVCGTTGLADEAWSFLPEKVRLTLHATCLLSIVFGLTSAKDANVTHTPALAATEPKAIKP